MADILERLKHNEIIYQEDEGKPEGSLYLEAAEEITKLRASTQWQPIETAPKDGADVLVVSCEGVEVAWLSDRGEWLSNGGKDVYAEPTHWMSLPAPPNECKPD